MGPAFARAALTPQHRIRKALGGRLWAALPLFLALTACGRKGQPKVDGVWRIGMGATDMALSPSGGALAVACGRSNDVWVLSTVDGKLLHRIDSLPRPRAVMFHPEREAYYVAEGLSSVAQVRLDDERVARRFKPRSRVSRMAYEPHSGRIFAGHQGLPTLGVYRLRDMHLEASLALGGELTDLAFDGNEAWLCTRRADALVHLSLTNLSVKAAILAGPDPRRLALKAGLDRAFVACHGRTGEAAPLALPTPIPTADALSALEGVSESSEALEEDASAEGASEAEPVELPIANGSWDGGGLAVFRLSDARRVDYIELPGGPVALVASPSGGMVAVACEDGQLRFVDLRLRRSIRTLALGGRPTTMLMAPDAKHLYVALADQKSLLLVSPGQAW